MNFEGPEEYSEGLLVSQLAHDTVEGLAPHIDVQNKLMLSQGQTVNNGTWMSP